MIHVRVHTFILFIYVFIVQAVLFNLILFILSDFISSYPIVFVIFIELCCVIYCALILLNVKIELYK